MTAAMVPLETALSGAIGARVRITTHSPTPSPASTSLEGTLFTACPITNLVAINTKPNLNPSDAKQAQAGDYHIIPVSRIQNLQILSLASASSNNSENPPSFADAVPPVQALDIRALKNREATAIGKVLEGEARRGKGVTQEAQDLFDAFSRTMPAHWDRTSIVVADAVTVAAPYRVDDCRPLVAGDTAALNRVRKVLEMERKKIELRNASASISAQPSNAAAAAAAAAGQRKGG